MNTCTTFIESLNRRTLACAVQMTPGACLDHITAFVQGLSCARMPCQARPCFDFVCMLGLDIGLHVLIGHQSACYDSTSVCVFWLDSNTGKKNIGNLNTRLWRWQYVISTLIPNIPVPLTGCSQLNQATTNIIWVGHGINAANVTWAFLTLIGRSTYPSCQVSFDYNNESKHIERQCCYGIIQWNNRWHHQTGDKEYVPSFKYRELYTVWGHKMWLVIVKCYMTNQRNRISCWLLIIVRKYNAHHGAIPMLVGSFHVEMGSTRGGYIERTFWHYRYIYETLWSYTP